MLFRSIPPMTGERLVELTQRFENFTLQIKNAIGFIEGFKDTVQETIDAITGADSGVSETNLVSGASNASVNVTETLGVEASGAAHVSYSGNPKVTSHVSGHVDPRHRKEGSLGDSTRICDFESCHL